MKAVLYEAKWLVYAESEEDVLKIIKDSFKNDWTIIRPKIQKVQDTKESEIDPKFGLGTS